MMSGAIPVILNPAAKSTRARHYADEIRALTPQAELIETIGPNHAEELAERLVREGHKLVVAAGGDGTVNEALQGLCRANASLPEGEQKAALGVLPVGTMNVFSLELEMGDHDLKSCWRRIVAGDRREVDLWRANDRYFIQLAGVGIDAEIIKQTTWELKKKLGPLSYVMSGLKVLRRAAPVLRVDVEGELPRYGKLVLVGNGRRYGGPFPVFGRADMKDGLLDVLVFHQVGPLELAQLIRDLTQGIWPPESEHDYDSFRCAEFSVTGLDEDGQPTPAPIELDGELRGETPARFARVGSLFVVG